MPEAGKSLARTARGYWCSRVWRKGDILADSQPEYRRPKPERILSSRSSLQSGCSIFYSLTGCDRELAAHNTVPRGCVTALCSEKPLTLASRPRLI